MKRSILIGLVLLIIVKVYAVSIISPAINITNNNTIQLIATLNGTNCSYSIDSNTTIINCTPVFNTTLNLTEGIHVIRVCDNNCKEKTITIDTTPPGFVLVKPTQEINTKETTLEVLVNEYSTCKYSSSNESFSSMLSMNTLDGLSFKKILTNLDEGSHTYYVKCRDKANNINTKKISFIVNLPPQISITIKQAKKKDSTYLLKAGVYPIQLTSSEPLQQASLYYMFNDQTSKHVINLIPNEDKTVWNGYLIISKGTQNKAGSFYYSAKDFDGLTTSGVSTMFLIDTIPPDAVDSFTYELSNNTVTLKWHHPYENEVDHYNLYKSTKPGVSYTNLLLSLNNTQYTEKLSPGVYYYRVSAVDYAGNEGKLSNELKVVIKQQQKTVKKNLTLEKKINETKKKKQLLLLDIDTTINDLESKQDEEAFVIDTLGLIPTLRGIKSKVNKLVVNANSLSQIDKQLENYRQALPKAVEITSKKSWIQSLNNKPTLIAEKYLLVKKRTNQGVDSYADKIQHLMDQAVINSEAYKVRVIYMDGSEKTFIVIHKKINYGFNGDEDIVEYIPKTIAQNYNNIVFRVSPNVIERDPIVYWSYSATNGEITYYVSKDSLLDVQSTKTFIMPSIKEQNSLTGEVVKTTNFTQTIWDHIVMIVGLIAVLGLAIYYYLYTKPVENIDSFSMLYNKKVDEYNELLNKYNALKLIDKQRALLLAHRLKHLYIDLSILELIKDSITALSTKDIASLHYLLGELRRLYPSTTDDYIRSIALQYINHIDSFLKSNDPFMGLKQ